MLLDAQSPLRVPMSYLPRALPWLVRFVASATPQKVARAAARLVCAEAVQMHGGIGFTWELDLHFYFKRAKTYEMHYGSTEAQLDRVLAAAGF